MNVCGSDHAMRSDGRLSARYDETKQYLSVIRGYRGYPSWSPEPSRAEKSRPTTQSKAEQRKGNLFSFELQISTPTYFDVTTVYLLFYDGIVDNLEMLESTIATMCR
jgi:hypothetical protein